MIRIEDLMVGNWVYDTVLKKAIILNNLPYGIDLSNREGIPVTVDILKRIGFEEDTTAGEPWPFWRYWDKDGRYKLDVYPDELYCNSNRKFGLHVDNDVCNTIGCGEFTYVHELQNLVRIITGHSLPITIEMLYGLGNES